MLKTTLTLICPNHLQPPQSIFLTTLCPRSFPISDPFIQKKKSYLRLGGAFLTNAINSLTPSLEMILFFQTALSPPLARAG